MVLLDLEDVSSLEIGLLRKGFRVWFVELEDLQLLGVDAG